MLLRVHLHRPRRSAVSYSSRVVSGKLYSRLSISEMRSQLETGKKTSVQITTKLLDQMISSEALKINSMISVCPELALKAAKESDVRRTNGTVLGPLDGVPIVVKDNFCVEGTVTTCASKMLKDFKSPYTATAVSRLLDQGAVVLGKANMDEFAMGSGGTHSVYGMTLNPHKANANNSRKESDWSVAGGSSSGSAAAVAAGLCPGAIGSDTGGSVRLPASYCGLVGYKPTYGLISRHGLIAYGSSFDCPSILTNNVDDAACMLGFMSGNDDKDPTTSAKSEFSYTRFKQQNEQYNRSGLSGLRIGVPQEYYTKEISQEVLRVWKEAIAVLMGLGAKVERISLPSTKHALPAYYILAPAEASSNLARYDGVEFGYRSEKDRDGTYLHTRGEGFGDNVKARVILGTFCLSRDVFQHDYYDKAARVRTMIRDDFKSVFAGEHIGDVAGNSNSPNNSANANISTKSEDRIKDTNENYSQDHGEPLGRGVHLILTPSSCGTAPTVSEWNAMSGAEQNANDVFTVPASLAGLPAISVPCGTDANLGMPIGLQLIGPTFSDGHVLSVAEILHRELQPEGVR
eukprot:CFRG2411T1